MIFGYSIQSLQLTLPTVRSVSPRWHFSNDINITDENLREKGITFKKGEKTVHTANKMVYVESMRKLLKGYNSSHTPVSLTTFFTYKPFYCVVPTEKEKQSCACVNRQNSHLLLETINRYRTTQKLTPRESRH